MLLIYKGLPCGEKALSDYVDAWSNLLRAAEAADRREVQRSLFDHFYENLSILDGKTNSLLQLNGILIAAYTFVMSSLKNQMDDNARDVLFLGAAYAASGLVLCLSVLWVHWSSVGELKDAMAHVRKLIVIRNARTIAYRRAWTFSLASLAALVALLVSLAFPTEQSLRPLLVTIAAAHLFLILAHDHVVLALQRKPQPREKPKQARSRKKRPGSSEP